MEFAGEFPLCPRPQLNNLLENTTFLYVVYLLAQENTSVMQIAFRIMIFPFYLLTANSTELDEYGQLSWKFFRHNPLLQIVNFQFDFLTHMVAITEEFHNYDQLLTNLTAEYDSCFAHYYPNASTQCTLKYEFLDEFIGFGTGFLRLFGMHVLVASSPVIKLVCPTREFHTDIVNLKSQLWCIVLVTCAMTVMFAFNVLQGLAFFYVHLQRRGRCILVYIAFLPLIVIITTPCLIMVLLGKCFECLNMGVRWGSLLWPTEHFLVDDIVHVLNSLTRVNANQFQQFLQPLAFHVVNVNGHLVGAMNRRSFRSSLATSRDVGRG